MFNKFVCLSVQFEVADMSSSLAVRPLTHKVPITTAADNSLEYFFIVFLIKSCSSIIFLER